MQGKVTDQALRQLFDSALSTAFPDIAQGHAPCLNVAMHSEGRYAFVELATPAMATAALQLSGQLDFLGSQITVGRPSGYIDPAKAAAAAAAATKALQVRIPCFCVPCWENNNNNNADHRGATF